MIVRYWGILILALSLGACERLNIPSEPAPAERPIEIEVEVPLSTDSLDLEITSEGESVLEETPDVETQEESLDPVAEEGLPETWWNALDDEEKQRWKIPVKTRRVRLNWGAQGRHLLAYKAKSDGWLVLEPDVQNDPELILEQTNGSLEPLLSNEEYGVMKSRELVVDVVAGEWVFLRIRPAVQTEEERPVQFLSLVKKERK